MAWAGTVTTPFRVLTLMASPGPFTSGPHQALAAGTGNGDSGGLGGRWPPPTERGDHGQDHGHDGQPDSTPQTGSGLSGSRLGADAVSVGVDGVSDLADSEDRQASDRECGHGQRGG